MILILTAPDDVHADAAEVELLRRGASWLRFDPASFPAEATLSVRLVDGHLHRTLTYQGRTIDLATVTALWFRRPGRAEAPGHLTGWVSDFVARESDAFVGDVWETLDVPAVPAPRSVVRRAQYKVLQLQLAVAVGFEVPATVVGNDPDAVLDLFNSEGGRIITKQVGLNDLSERLARYTEEVRTRDVVHAEGLRHCPVIAQARVAKRLELRVTVVGEQVFGAAIHSQRANHTQVDWRRYDDRNTPIEPWSLPAEVSARCVDITRRLGLRYGAIDMVLTPDGRYVFIEINPSGQYLWIENATGLPITAAIVDLLQRTGAPTFVPSVAA